MKRIWIFLMAMLSIVSFTGCDMTEESSGPVTVIDYEFDRTYIINNDRCCVFKGLKPVSAADIENKVKGYGWKVIGMYKVQDNGRLSQTDYRKTVYGGGYMDYWFESDGHLIGFHHGDTDAKFYNKTEWFYDAVTGFIMCGSASQSMQSRYMQVLLLTKTESNYLQMHTMQKLGDTTDENGNLKPFYGMVVYQRMTDNELEATKKAYGYDANVNYTIDSEHNNNNIVSPLYKKNNSNEKISMVIVAISAMISLSGCHEDPTYVDSYFQRQSVIEELSNELKGQYSSIFIPVIYNASQEQMDYKSLWKGEVTENGQPIIHYTFGGYENRTVTLQQVPISWISFVIKDTKLAEAVKLLPDYDISIPYSFVSSDEETGGASKMGKIIYSDSKVAVTLNYGGQQHLVLFNFKCPSQFVFDADKRPISPGRIQLELKSIIVDNVIVQEIDGYSGEEFFLSILDKTDPISK